MSRTYEGDHFPANPPNVAALPLRETLNSMPQLSPGNHANVQLVFQRFSEPGNDLWIRLRLGPFGNHVGVEQIAHKFTGRGPSLTLVTTSPDPRSGDRAKNSTIVPLRLVRRSHSSGETMTATLRPWRVTVCGPFDSARAITSLNLALAFATLHVAVVGVVILVIIVTFCGHSSCFTRNQCHRNQCHLDSNGVDAMMLS